MSDAELASAIRCQGGPIKPSHDLEALMHVRNLANVACTPLTDGLLEQNNLLLQLILRDHCQVVSLNMCNARFIPSPLH